MMEGCRDELGKRFKKVVREARREEEVSATLRLLPEGFGKPHAPTGLAIRKLGSPLYEGRTGLAWRLIFEACKGVLTFDFAGDPDEVRGGYLGGARSGFAEVYLELFLIWLCRARMFRRADDQETRAQVLR